MEAHAVTVRQGTGFAVSTLPEVCQLAEILWKSNLFPGVASVNQAVVKILLGAEFGFGPFASMSDIHIIEGRPSLGAHLRAAAIKRSDKYDYALTENTDAAVAADFYERDGNGKDVRKGTKGWNKAGTLRYTLDDAKAKGWTSTQGGKVKGTWQKTPRNMLFARVLSDGYRFFCPDLTAGVLVYDADELEGTAQQQESQPPRALVTAVTVNPPGPGNGQPSEPAPEADDRATAVRTASDLIAWLGGLERDLEAEGCCAAGQLMARVTEEGNRAGFPGKVVDWAGPALQLGVQSGLAGAIWFRKSGLVSRIDVELQRLNISAVPFTKRLREKYGTDDPFALNPDQLAEILAKLQAGKTPPPDPTPAPAATVAA